MAESKVVVPKLAATILLCRDAPEGLEVFMVVRHHQIDFASGALVFPGGKVAESDMEEGIRDLCAGVDGVPDDHLAVMVAAIREAFEESGILMAREQGSADPVSGERLGELEGYRERLNADEIGIVPFLKQEGLVLACDCLTRFAHWTTPAMMPKRFDTHFFIARAPADHVGAHDGSESVDSIWITPEKLLREADDGKWTVIFPTRCNILMLGESADVDEAIEKSRDRKIVEVLPWVEQREDGPFLCIPPEAGYPIPGAKMDKEMR